jgi:regulator of sirC expression with transglutaminase-like and TPR domain
VTQNNTSVEQRIAELAAAEDELFDAPRAALYLAALDRADLDLIGYEAHLEDLAAAVAERPSLSPAHALADVVAGAFGYCGDRQTYDDMKNADLIDVIDRRRGLPVALGLLYLAAARGLEVPLVGLTFPGHFLLRVESGDERVIIDPFNDGRPTPPSALRSLAKRILGAETELEPGFFAPVTERSVLIRLLMNVRIRSLKAGERARAIEISRRMTLVAPKDARLWADLGELHVSNGNLSAAKVAFEKSLDSAPDDDFRIAAEAALQSVSRRLN